MARRADTPVVLLGLAGLMLAAAAALSLFAALRALPAEPIVAALREREAVAADDAAAAARASLRAAAWFETGRYLTDAAMALTVPGAARDGLPTAGAVVTRALVAHPISPYNWTRLAIVRRTGGDTAAAMRAWEMSVLSGRYVPGLMLPRLDVGFGLMGAAGPEQVRLLGDQVRIVARLDAAGLAAVARRRRVEPFVRAALTAAPDLLETFEATDRAAQR